MPEDDRARLNKLPRYVEGSFEAQAEDWPREREMIGVVFVGGS